MMAMLRKKTGGKVEEEKIHIGIVKLTFFKILLSSLYPSPSEVFHFLELKDNYMYGITQIKRKRLTYFLLGSLFLEKI
jgi:hypothetical protein